MKNVIIDGKEMTCKEAHYMLWDWMAEHVDCDKGDFFTTHNCNIIPSGDCFACEEFADDDNGCGSCPLYNHGCTLFWKWRESTDDSDIKKYALLIRDAWKD